MGYVIWDSVAGGPANKTRYWTMSRAATQCLKLNFRHDGKDSLRYHVKEL